MKCFGWMVSAMVRLVVVGVVMAGSTNAVYAQGAKAVPVAPVAAAPADDPAITQKALIKLVRLSPTLTAVVERDPSLLSDKEYVGRTNPELAQFLETHPEVARNPDFYLFTELQTGHGHVDLLQRKVWPDEGGPREEYTPAARLFEHAIMPFLIFLCVLAAVIWLIHTFVQSRRWTRASRQQLEAHGKLMDRFGNSQELLAYMSSDAGRRFLESAPIPMDLDGGQRLPNAVSRVLLSLQIGTVLTLLGAGLMMLRHPLPEQSVPLLVTGTVFLMPGLGFLISAGVTWVLAGKLGLMPVVDTGSQR